MLKVIGVSSVDQLIEQTVPKHIRWYAGKSSEKILSLLPFQTGLIPCGRFVLTLTLIWCGPGMHAASLWRPRWLAPEASPNCWPSFET